jgi:hypothetical protein
MDKTLPSLDRRLAAGDGAILRSAGKHFDEIVVQSVIELALEMPRELGMIKIAGMDLEYVGVDRDYRILQIDQNFDKAIVLASREGKQRVIVELQVIENLLQGVGVGHRFIVLSFSSQFPVLSSQ